MGEVAPAAKAYGLKGVPAVDLAWTDPDIDTGSIHVTASPYQGPSDLTAPLTSPALRYNTLPLAAVGFFGGAVEPTGGGTAQTWAHAARLADGRRVRHVHLRVRRRRADGLVQLPDGIIESFEITGAEGLGPLEPSMNWRFGDVASTGSTDRPVAAPSRRPTSRSTRTRPSSTSRTWRSTSRTRCPASVPGRSSKALHAMVLRGNQEVDQKRYADGDQVFAIDDYGRGMQSIELECTFAKTDQTVGVGSESDAWMSDEPVTRYAQMRFEAPRGRGRDALLVDGLTLPIRYYTREEGDLNNNTTVVLTGHAFYDPDDFRRLPVDGEEEPRRDSR